MNEEFWINITKPGILYVLEIWMAGEDRILYVEKRKSLTKFGAYKRARKIAMRYLSNQYIKEKL